MSEPVYRFAPSPNGRLHLGHAYSALLNARMAEEDGGKLLVRIEDTDTTRCTPDLARAALDDLAWLGLRWETPVRIQSEHFADYEKTILQLRTMGCIYPCFCSRKDAAVHALSTRDPDGQPLYGGTCRSLGADEADRRIARGDQHGWRIDMRACGTPDAAVWGDAMLAKLRTGSAYHIAVVTDDAIQGVTHVVRGRDLEAATSLHRLLQKRLGLPAPHYHHHDLITDDFGLKLSKSRKSAALAELRAEGVTPAEVRRRLGFG